MGVVTGVLVATTGLAATNVMTSALVALTPSSFYRSFMCFEELSKKLPICEFYGDATFDPNMRACLFSSGEVVGRDDGPYTNLRRCKKHRKRKLSSYNFY